VIRLRHLRHLAAACVVAAAFATTTAATTHAQTQPAPGVDYVATLHQALDALPDVPTLSRDDPGLARPRTLLQQAAALGPSRAALQPILDDLDRDPAGVHDARDALQTLVNAVDLPQGSVAEDPHAAQGALHDVYGQSQFSGLGTRTQSDDIFTRIGRAILDFFRWLVSHIGSTLGTIPSLILAALIIAAIVGFVVWRLQRAGIAPLRGAFVAEPPATGTDPDDEWRLALTAAARCDHRDAVRHAFRSALLSIAVAGRLHIDAVWTTGELLARARGDADLVAALAPAADSFDRAWYSGRPVTAEDWEVAQGRCQAVRQLAGRRRVASA
jgi:hypothetical protein